MSNTDEYSTVDDHPLARVINQAFYNESEKIYSTLKNDLDTNKGQFGPSGELIVRKALDDYLATSKKHAQVERPKLLNAVGSAIARDAQDKITLQQLLEQRTALDAHIKALGGQ